MYTAAQLLPCYQKVSKELIMKVSISYQQKPMHITVPLQYVSKQENIDSGNRETKLPHSYTVRKWDPTLCLLERIPKMQNDIERRVTLRA